MNDSATSHALDYTRRLHKDVNDWYTSADNKAQILLTLNGVLLGFLGSAAFWGADKLQVAVDKNGCEKGCEIGYETFAFFIAFLMSLGVSITSALICLKSRLRHDAQEALPPVPENIWFFQRLPGIAPQEFARKLRSVTPEMEIEALSSQIQILSFNVINKHVWFNRGFKFFVLGLLCFLMVVASYVVRLYAKASIGFSPWLTFASFAVVAAAASLYWWLDNREESKTREFQRKFGSPSPRPETAK